MILIIQIEENTYFLLLGLIARENSGKYLFKPKHNNILYL